MTNSLSFRAIARNLHLLLSIAVTPPLSAQPTDTSNADRAKAIVMRHMEAIGGMEAYSAVKSVHTTLSIRMPVAGAEVRMETWVTKPNLAYVIARSEFGTSEGGFDGKTFWSNDSGEGAKLLNRPPDLLNAAVFDPLSAWARYEVKYLGQRERGGRKMEALQMVAGDGQLYTQYYDIETGLFSRLEVGNPSAPLSSMKFDRYKKFGSLLYATAYTTKVGDGNETTSRVLKVDHDPVDPKRYELPKELRDLAARRP
jgi:hypothetical protein